MQGFEKMVLGRPDCLRSLSQFGGSSKPLVQAAQWGAGRLRAGCLDVMYVPELATRREGLDFLDCLEKGTHLQLPTVRLEKAAALIIEPHSTGA